MALPDGPRPVVDTHGAAELLGISYDRVRQLADEGVLPVGLESVIRPSGRRFRWFYVDEVAALAEERRPKPPVAS